MNGNLPILYSFRRCPYAMRARMVLRYSGIQVELREVVLRDKPTDLLAVSPKATVPVMIVDGEVLEESIDIMLWALDKSDPKGWLDGVEEARKLIEINDLSFKPHLDGYKYSRKNDEKAKQLHRFAAAEIVADIDTRLAARPFLFGEEASLADFALFPFIRQFANVDIGWFEAQPYGQVHGWLLGLIESEIFVEIMQKYPPWRRGDPITVL